MKCMLTKRFLTEHNIQFEEHLVNDEMTRERLKSHGFSSLPVVDTGQEMFAGFQPQRLATLK